MINEVMDTTKGIDKIFSSDNIAIVVLMVCLMGSAGFNIYLLRNLLKVKDVMQSVALAIAILNERLHSNDKTTG